MIYGSHHTMSKRFSQKVGQIHDRDTNTILVRFQIGYRQTRGKSDYSC